MTPTSDEIRKLLIEAKKRGETEKSIAKRLKISERSVTTIWKLYREIDSYLPTPSPTAFQSTHPRGVRRHVNQ